MKKFIIVALAAFICLAFTLPAMAKVTVGGRIALDWTYLDQDAQQAAGGVALGSSTTSNGFKDMNMIIPSVSPLNGSCRTSIRRKRSPASG